MDAVQKAKSGHPGTPMALAPVAYTLWQDRLRFDPMDPTWPNRDRFVLSVGHASMLLYSLLHLTGTRRIGEHGPTQQEAVSLDDIKQFRQLSSVTPGHPEYSYTSGVETTTGPLGQGVANSVGMAMAQRWFETRYNQPGFELYTYRVYALCGDGDMMEGVSSEAASTAAHLKLSNLVWIYDSNNITIEGNTSLAFDEDVGARFAAYGWHVIHVNDANDTAAFDAALTEAEGVTDRPTFIMVHSVIGYGAPKKQGTREAHGEPLGDEEIKAAKRFYGWPEDAQFLVPGRRAGGVHQAHGRPRRGPAGQVDGHAGQLPQVLPGAGGRTGHDGPPSVAGWLGQGHPGVPRGREGPGVPRQLAEGAERHRPARPLADRRRGGPGALHEVQPDLPRRQQLRVRRLRRAATCTSASASTRWGPSATASR